jgi:hypothetical protein
MKKLFFIFMILTWTGINLTAVPVRTLIKKTGSISKYPGAGYVVIFDSTKVDMQESGLSYFNEHKLIKVLTPKGGKKFNVYKYDYDPMSAYAEIQKVVIYYKDGTEKVLTKNDELDYPAPAGTILWGARQKMVELGRLEAGDAFEIFLFKKGFTYALLQDDDERYIPPMRGHFYDIVPFWSDTYILKKVYQVAIPNTKKTVQYKVYNGKIDLVKKNLGEKTLYKFTLNNIKPLYREPNMVSPSDVATKLLISTAPDWYSKSKWFCGVNEDYGSFESTPEIDAKVKEILKGAKSEWDSVSRLNHWVADELRYLGLSMGKGEGFTLHKGSMDYLDRCGVCKDKAGMLITMLRSAGFTSYPAMTMAGSRIDRIPADQFNHSVVVVKLSDGKWHLLDPTWVPFVREDWSSAEQQQNYLPGIPEGSDLLETPVSPPENHYVKIKATSAVDSAGTLKGEITVEAEGQSDAALRRMFTGSYKALWRSNLEREILSVAPQSRIVSLDYGKDPYDYMAGPIKLKIKYEIRDYAIAGEGELVFVPFAGAGVFRRVLGELYINTSLEKRRYPFRDRCSRSVAIEDVTTIPAGYELVWKPELKQVDSEAATFEGTIEQKDNSLVLTEKMNYNKRIYQPEEWPGYLDAVLMQKKIIENPVILKLKK